MRFVLAALALISAPAGAVTFDMTCSFLSGGASCGFPLKDPLPGFNESHLDKGGTYEVLFRFDQPLAADVLLEGYRVAHWDAYNANRELIDGNTHLPEIFFTTMLGAGLTSVSFNFTVPDVEAGTPSDNWPYVFWGANHSFQLSSSTSDPVGRFSASVSTAVPEPASWAMMVIGFGMLGAAFRGYKPDIAGRLTASTR